MKRTKTEEKYVELSDMYNAHVRECNRCRLFDGDVKNLHVLCSAGTEMWIDKADSSKALQELHDRRAKAKQR